MLKNEMFLYSKKNKCNLPSQVKPQYTAKLEKIQNYFTTQGNYVPLKFFFPTILSGFFDKSESTTNSSNVFKFSLNANQHFTTQYVHKELTDMATNTLINESKRRSLTSAQSAIVILDNNHAGDMNINLNINQNQSESENLKTHLVVDSMSVRQTANKILDEFMNVFKNAPLTKTTSLAKTNVDSNLITSILNVFFGSDQNTSVGTIIDNHTAISESFANEKQLILNDFGRANLSANLAQQLEQDIRQEIEVTANNNTASGTLTIKVDIAQITATVRHVLEKHKFINKLLQSIDRSQSFRIDKKLMLMDELNIDNSAQQDRTDEQFTGFIKWGAILALAVLFIILVVR